MSLTTQNLALRPRSRARRVIVSLLTTSLLAGVAVTRIADAATAAGTTIGNQASASYTDTTSGLPQTATSNLVQTQVSNVGSFGNATGTTKNGAAGNTLYMPHTIQNTGNFADNFSILVTDPGGAG